MVDVLFKLITVFGAVPWLQRFIGLGFNPQILEQLSQALNIVTGSTDVNSSIALLQNNKKLELEFQKALLMAESAYWQQCMQDRQQARERDIVLQRINGRNRRANIMLIMAVVGIISSVGCLIIFRAALTADVLGMISAVAAIFGSCLKDAYSFEFGSSGKMPVHDRSNQFTIDRRSK